MVTTPTVVYYFTNHNVELCQWGLMRIGFSNGILLRKEL
jgi:hypothetical protein